MVSSTADSALHKHAADILRRARSLPPGADRNDLRQLAIGLRWLERNGSDTAQIHTLEQLQTESIGPGDR
jgi:hypothetical protein